MQYKNVRLTGAIFTLMLMISTTGFSQKFIRFGLTAGPQLMSLSSTFKDNVELAKVTAADSALAYKFNGYKLTTKNTSYKPVVSFNAGLTTEVGFGEKFSTQLDLLYTSASFDRNYGYQWGNKSNPVGYYDRTLYYIYNNKENISEMQAHLLFKLNLSLPRKFIIPYDREGRSYNYVSFFAGPYVGMVQYARTGWDSVYGFLNTGEQFSKQALFTPITDHGLGSKDLGVTLGTGIYFHMGHGKYFGIDARYSKGLTTLDVGNHGRDAFVTYVDANGQTQIKTDENGLPIFDYKRDNLTLSSIGLNLSFKWELASKDH